MLSAPLPEGVEVLVLLPPVLAPDAPVEPPPTTGVVVVGGLVEVGVGVVEGVVLVVGGGVLLVVAGLDEVNDDGTELEPVTELEGPGAGTVTPPPGQPAL